MSRRNRNRNRPPAGISLPGQTQQQNAQPTFSRPVQIDRSKLEILDMKLLLSIPQLAQSKDEAGAAAAMPALIDMLDRVVIGGLAGRPVGEFWALADEAFRQISEAGNPKN